MKSALLTTTGLLLSTAVLATGCGGGGNDAMRVSLTDHGCAYEGDTTPAPGRFNIEFENKTSHWVIFTVSALRAGKTLEDVRHAMERGRPSYEVEIRGVGNATTDPHETKVMPANESSGRLVIVCWVHNSAPPSDGILPPPAVWYVVPVELEVR